MKQATFLPCTKGFFGDWVYYSCSVPVQLLVENVLFAKDMYSENTKWSEMLQRDLKEERGNEIATYLSTAERFFNSLVIGVYAGAPEWLDINIQKSVDNEEIEEIPDETKNKVGFLRLSGTEKLYALDGQHRLLGMKVALANGFEIAHDDVPVIFVSIGTTAEGRIRARRLFSTINKRAINVGLGAKIALDEDNVIAIVTRKLVDSGELFDSKIILLRSNASLPANEMTALTTAGNLYDVVKDLLVTYAKKREGFSKGILKLLTDGKRPNDETIDEYYTYAANVLRTFIFNNKYLNEYFSTNKKEEVIQKYRGQHGGKIFFRPVGLQLFAKLFVECDGSIEERIHFMNQYLPQDLQDFPYKEIIWDTHSNGIAKGSGRLTKLVHLCRHMLGFKLTSRQNYSMRLGLSYIQNKSIEDVEIPVSWINSD